MRRMALTGGLAILLAAALTGWPALADSIDFGEHTVEANLDGARHAQVIDLDEDGDNDVVACGYWSGDIFWYENSGAGTFSRGDIGNGNFATANHFDVADLDGDGDLDVIGVSFDPGTLAWWRNNGSETFTRTNIATDGIQNASSCTVVDLDDDGDLDVLVSSFYEDKIAWFENDGSENFTRDDLLDDSLHLNGANCVWAGDVDDDGDQDIATVAFHGDRITWWENNGNESFARQTLSATFEGASWIEGTDLDDDGDMDFVGTAMDVNRLAWWENDGAENFTAHNIDTDLAGAIHGTVVDMDNDGDLDVAATAFNGWEFYWYDNNGSENFTRRVVTETAARPQGVAAGDLDGDNDVDLVLCDYEGDEVFWYESGGSSTSPFYIVAGPGPGPANEPRVKGFHVNGSENGITDFLAYGATGYGVNVTCGDIDGDGNDEIVTGAGPGEVYGPHVRAFEWDGTPIGGLNFLAYGTAKWGVNVACGDVDGDGIDEIITGAGPGAVFGPHVRGWNFDGGTVTPISAISFFAYGTPKWGVNVACGDVDGDGFDEIITGAGPGGVYGPHVRAWNYDGGILQNIRRVSFLAYSTNRFGVKVTAGDVDGDGYDEIVTGAGPGMIFNAHVRGWNYDNGSSTTAISEISYFAYDTDWVYGVNVGCVDLDDDGYGEILTGPGPGSTQPALVRGWNYDGTTLQQLTGTDFYAFDETTVFYGVNVYGGSPE